MKEVRVGILDCASGPQAKYFFGGSLSDLFINAFQSASRRRSERIDLNFSVFDCLQGEFPHPNHVDALIITGSLASAYDQDNWILDLSRYTRYIYENFPNIRIFGACFGHQLVAHVLLADHGIIVEKNPRNRQIGVRSISLNPMFCSMYPALPPDTKVMRLQVVHGDYVNFQQKKLPPGWVVVGSSNCCDIHGLYQAGRVLTLQAHLEFDKDVCDRIMRSLFSPDQGFPVEPYEKALKDIEHPVDVAIAEDMMLTFLVGEA